MESYFDGTPQVVVEVDPRSSGIAGLQEPLISRKFSTTSPPPKRQCRDVTAARLEPRAFRLHARRAAAPDLMSKD